MEQHVHILVCQPQLIQEHYQTMRKWENPQKKGRFTKEKVQNRELPWQNGVKCKQFFKQGPYSIFFGVEITDILYE
jgi:hypothetical protein